MEHKMEIDNKRKNTLLEIAKEAIAGGK